MTDEQIKDWLVDNYQKGTYHGNILELGISKHKYGKMVDQLEADGRITRKKNYTHRVNLSDKEFAKKYLSRKGTVQELADSLGVDYKYIECRMYRIRKKVKHANLRAKKDFLCFSYVSVHPIITNKWVPGFLEGAK